LWQLPEGFGRSSGPPKNLPEIRACFGAFVWRACGEIAREDSLLEITLFQTVGPLKTGGKVNKREADSLYN